jgi:flavin reductase (DIM6/NTAB) family NADH-FMN oxidoreductase RutF
MLSDDDRRAAASALDMAATIDQQTFRHVIGHVASGVTVITARREGVDHGATASAVSWLSLEPPMLLVCLNRRSVTQDAIHRSRAFGLNILDEDQGVLAERFATPMATSSPAST